VHDGDQVALEGFTHLAPCASGHEIIRQGRRNLTLIRMTPDIVYDQMIGAGCASKLVFSWGGNPGVGSLHRFREAVEKGWPQPLEIDEHEHAGMAARYAAGASHLPFGILRGYLGTDLAQYSSSSVKFIDCPFTGEKLAAVSAIRPDVAVIHAQKADRRGNIMMWGLLGAQKEVVLASKRAIVTVEEIVDDLHAPMNSAVICARLLRKKQRLLQVLGYRFAGSGNVSGMDGQTRDAEQRLRRIPAESGSGGVACLR
jgi:glutaconate CoA-transferase subunit A